MPSDSSKCISTHIYDQSVAFLDIYENCWLAGKMSSTNIKNIVSYSNSDDKVKFQLINEVGEPPNHETSWFYCSLSLEYKNQNLKSAKIAQPALKLELDLYIVE